MMTLTTTNGLDTLIQEIERGATSSVRASWSTWFEEAVSQLENDESIDARFTDAFAESLEEIDAAFAENRGVDGAFRGLVSLYYRHEEAAPLELRWRRRIAGLGAVQLETELWCDLVAALDAAAAGETRSVNHWLQSVKVTFHAAWTSYRDEDILPTEVSEESQLGHRFLGEGIAAWRGAIEEFQKSLGGNVDRASVLARARAGQELLVGLQVIEQESKDCVDHFHAVWSN